MANASIERVEEVVPLEEVPPIPKIACVLCSSPIDATARICNVCKSYQIGKSCVVCGKWIPGRATDCPECKGSQNALRRFFSLDATVLALLISLISVISSVGPGIIRMVNHGSQTSAYVVGVDRDEKTSKQKDVLVIRAINSGGQLSIITSAALDLTKAGGGSVPLRIVTGERHVQPGGGTLDLKLFARDEAFKIAQDKREGVIANLCTQAATIELKIEERSIFGKKRPDQPLSIPIDPNIIRGWAAQRLIASQPEACS